MNRSSLPMDALVEIGSRTNTPNYAPAPIVLSHGEGARLFDRDGREYLDFIAGIAVSIVGHAHPRLTAAIAEQAGRLLHVSNGFFTEPQILLQERLTSLCFAERVYFCNSGTEANEAAIKLVRRYQRVVAGTPRFEFITFEGSFHGRTYGAVSATAQPKYHAGFEPMVPGFVTARFGDLEDVASRIGPHTAAILVEPIQGEGGVRPASREFLEGLRRLADANGALLVFDEVQTGVARCGAWFAHQAYGVVPDVMTLAKGMGGGVPIGAMVTTEAVAAGFTRGSHASTFGGNPLATSAALTVLDIVESEGLRERAVAIGERLRAAESSLRSAAPVLEVRGMGALIGVSLDASPETVMQVVVAARERGLLINAVGATVLRIAPPLIVSDAQVDDALTRLTDALSSVFDRR